MIFTVQEDGLGGAVLLDSDGRLVATMNPDLPEQMREDYQAQMSNEIGHTLWRIVEDEVGALLCRYERLFPDETVMMELIQELDKMLGEYM